MDYTQSPFLRGDDYSLEVADLRDDINELAADISQINITLTDDIRNVDERLNVYQNNIKQNVYTNQLDTNVANINNANIDYVFARNVKTNILDANVLNIASINNTILVNPHIENMDSVNGQILNTEIINSTIVNGDGSFNSLNANTVNIASGSIKRVNIADSTLTNVVINGFDLNNPRYLNVNSANFNVANFNNIYGRNANFGYIERVNTDNVRTTNIIVNGDARFHIINADSANIKSIDATTISNAVLSNVKIKSDLVLTSNIKVNGIDANFIDVEDLRAKAISVQSLTDVNLIHANNVSSDWGYIQNFAAHNLTLDVSAQPKETPYVLGYDNNGKVFPAIAQGGGGGGSVVLPESADYIYTDAQGLPFKGVAATDLNDSNALVKASLVAPLSNKIDELTEMLSVLNELKPNQTVDYFNSISPLDYRNITSFETGKATIKDKNNYIIVADGVLGFTGLKVDNNVLHLDHTMNSFNYNKDLSYMFNGCSNFDGTGFDTIPDGTTNTAYMFADTKLKKPYTLPASVTNSANMYKNVLFETTVGENIDGLSDVTFKVGDSFGINVINSNINLYRDTEYVNNASLSVINSRIVFNNSNDLTNGFNFNNSNLYFEDATIATNFKAYNSNVTVKGDFKTVKIPSKVNLNNCEINAIYINDWQFTSLNMSYGNVYIGDNTTVNKMFAYSSSNTTTVVYPYSRTNWVGLYRQSKAVNMAFLNEILPTATNVDEMFYQCSDSTLNMNNIYSVLNKDITSLYKFQNGVTATYNSLADLRAVFPNVKNIGSSNVVKSDLRITEEDLVSFTDVSGILAKIPSGVTTFNVPTLTTLENTFWDGTNNVNIVISNNCTLAPNIYSRVMDRLLTGDLSGIKNGYYLYHSANQWFGYPENLEAAPSMYDNALFNEISEPIPSGLTNTAGMFENCWNITSIPGVMDLSNCIDASGMFRRCNNLTSVDFNFLKTLKPGASIRYMFSNCNNLVCNDFNVFTWIPEGVYSTGWFSGKIVSDVNTNNESIINTLNGLSVDGNVDISLIRKNYELYVLNNKSLNIDIDITSLSDVTRGDYNLAANKYNLSIKGTSTQDVNIKNLGYNISNSYFEASNVRSAYFGGGESSGVENSRFIFTNVDNATINGSYSYGGPMIFVYNSSIELNNVSYLKLTIMSGNNIHINQMPTNGFNLNSEVIVDSPASINVLDRYSYLYGTSFVDNRLNINILANNLYISGIENPLNIYLNSIGTDCHITGSTNNIIIHIPTNADLATGLNNGTYGSFPNENIIQY